MNGEPQPGPRPSPALRPALVAVLASVVAIGSIAIFSSGDDTATTNAAVATTTTTAAPTASPTATLTASSTTTVLLPPPVVASVPAPTDAATTAVLTTSVIAPTTASAASDSTSTTIAATAPADTIANGAGVPVIKAKAYAVFDVTSKAWLATSQADAPLPVGSIMKLLTADLVLQAGNLGKLVTVPDLNVTAAESSIGLYKGQKLTRLELLQAMLIVSANDAAQTLAIDLAGTAPTFVQEMNTAAKKLGLSNTVAANPIGLDDPSAHSSAHDVILLAAKLMQNGTFRNAVAQTQTTMNGVHFVSTDKLLTTYPGANGVKTGHTTQAGYCVVSSATRNGRTIMVAVLGAPSENERFLGAKALLDWAFARHP